MPLCNPPGHAQADFGEALVVIGEVKQKAHFFALNLPHSNAGLIQAYQAETTDAWLDRHTFISFGSVPLAIFIDNGRCMVARILLDGNGYRTQRFSARMSHYVIRDCSVSPGKGNEKGGVEGLVGFGRRNFMVPTPSVSNWDVFNAHLEEQ